jgi:hypothetical protein
VCPGGCGWEWLFQSSESLSAVCIRSPKVSNAQPSSHAWCVLLRTDGQERNPVVQRPILQSLKRTVNQTSMTGCCCCVAISSPVLLLGEGIAAGLMGGGGGCLKMPCERWAARTRERCHSWGPLRVAFFFWFGPEVRTGGSLCGVITTCLLFAVSHVLLLLPSPPPRPSPLVK